MAGVLVVLARRVVLQVQVALPLSRVLLLVVAVVLVARVKLLEVEEVYLQGAI